MTGQAPTSQSRLHANVLSNLSANVWLAAVTFLAIPFIYRGMGAAQYAVVGMYLLAIQWAAFLDLGLSPALGRFAARQGGEAGGIPRVRYLLSRFETINWGLGTLIVIVGALIFGLRESVLDEWRAGSEAPFAIAVMLLLTLALRIAANLYRAGLTGLEMQVQVSAVNSVIVSLRMGVPIVLALAGRLDLVGFFSVQVVVGVLEVLWFRSRLLNRLGSQRIALDPGQLRENMLMGLSISGLGLLWILSLQVDKLILSSNLSLENFGSFVLAVQIAGVVSLMTAPIQTAVLPRMTAQLAASDEQSVASLYTSSSMLCGALGIASAAAILVGGKALLELIAGEQQLPFELYQIVAVYAFINGLTGVMALSYALQNAVGVLRWHWMGAIGLSSIQVPMMYLLAQRGDVMLLALAYLGTLFAYIVLWLPQAHSRFLPVGHWTWLGRGLIIPALSSIPVAAVCLMLFSAEAGLAIKLVEAVLTFCLVFIAAIVANKDARTFLSVQLKRYA